VSEYRDGAVNTFYVHPGDLGLPKAAPEALRGGDATENARIARAVLAGERGAARDIVLLNAGASLLIAGAAANLAQGLTRATSALDSGATAATLERLARLSHIPTEASSRRRGTLPRHERLEFRWGSSCDAPVSARPKDARFVMHCVRPHRRE
jgi:anthranilate phosphoribosyltransferase